MQITIESVERHGDRWHVYESITEADGTVRRHLHVFPVDTLEWRAAEYGIDPKDTATLLDIVITEPHLTHEDYAAGVQLHTAPDIDTARKDHLARVAAVKLRHRIGTRGQGNPLARVEKESPIHPEVIAVKAEHVAQTRLHVQLAQRARPTVQATAAPSGAERAATLRERFGFDRNTA